MMDIHRVKAIAVAVLTGVAALALAVTATTVTSPGAAGGEPSDFTRGRIPNDAVREDGTIDFSLVPDFVAVWSRDGSQIAGYVRKEDLDPFEGKVTLVPDDYIERPMVVYGGDLKTVVGHMYSGKGFVSVDTDVSDVPDFPVELSGAD